jgi:hypothetical protein
VVGSILPPEQLVITNAIKLIANNLRKLVGFIGFIGLLGLGGKNIFNRPVNKLLKLSVFLIFAPSLALILLFEFENFL